MNYRNYLGPDNPVVSIKVKDYGTITLELFYQVAPNTVSNFISLVEKDYYKDLIFHRIIPHFMIQGGAGESVKNIVGEFSQNGHENPLQHTRGVISMARTNDPNSASSQFFIMHKEAPHLDGSYAAFGGVTHGIEVVDKIIEQPRDVRDRPYNDIVIESITVDRKNKVYPKPELYL
jgi:peptidyl-prolyl cis-trans isomerase B (cyclophilin B)